MKQIDHKQRDEKKLSVTLVKSAFQDQSDRLQHLNAAQREAVTHKTGPVMVIAGAGTGKTRVITERIAHIIHSGWCRNDQVLALTFTEKAAMEMEERVDTFMPLGYEAIPIKTFHAFCDQLLREYGMDIGISPGFRILSGVDQWLFMKEHLFEFALDYYRPMGNPTAFIDSLTSVFGRFKEELNSPEDLLLFSRKKMDSANGDEDVLEGQRLMELAKAYALYQQLLIKDNFLDFADLHYKVIELLTKRPNILRHLQQRYQFVLVDEYQDTNIAQNTIVNFIVAQHKNLMVVGDDDQSIYKFRGAAISNILQFQEAYPDAKKVVLTQNYRSNQTILDFAYQSIQRNNPDRLEVKAEINKRLIGLRPGAEDSIALVHSTTIDQEVEYVLEIMKNASVPLSEIAILTRANAYVQPFIDAFKKHNIPYQFVSERGLYHKEEVMDLIAFLRVLANPADDISLYRILRMPIWNIHMELVTELIQKAKRNYRSVWKEIQQDNDCRLLSATIRDCLEFSKNHSAGETLHRFTETLQLYQYYLRLGTIEAEERIINIATFFGKIRDFERRSSEQSVIDFVNYLDMAEEAGENPAAKFQVEDRDGVFISTIHGAKGLEFNTVFLTGLVNQRFPSMDRKDPIPIPDALVHEILTDADIHIQEERRLFYVAVTRAKESLHLLHSDYYAPSSSANPRKKKRSRFVDEIIDDVNVMQVEKTVEGVGQFLKPIRSSNESREFEFASSGERITQFSYSQLTQFKRCPRQYQYQYIYKIPQPPNGNFSFGSTMHNTLQEFYKVVGQTRQASLFTEFEPDFSLDKLLSIYEEKWISQGYESGQHMELRKNRGREILSQFYEHFKKDIPRVRFLEKAFKLRAGDYTISGRIDRADDLPDGTLEIIDYKTGRSKSENDVKKDLQLFIYALAARECFGIPATRLTLYFLDDDLQVSVDPDVKKMEQVKNEVIELGNAINQSDFSPTPEKFTCQNCPYKGICDAAAS